MAAVPSRVLTTDFDHETAAFYRDVLERAEAASVPLLIGGAYAFTIYTGIERHTKDLDVFVRHADFDRLSAALSKAGYRTEMTFPHWLGKAYRGPLFVDLIFNSGNGVTPVDDAWFEHAAAADVLGVRARIMPVEEMICSKAFIMERERYDGADVAHLLRACARTLDWERLLKRFGPHWRVLLSYLVLFGYIYPGERKNLPAAVLASLLDRLEAEETAGGPDPLARLCRGTLLSREQFLPDVLEQGYVDARIALGNVSAEHLAIWTKAIPERGGENG